MKENLKKIAIYFICFAFSASCTNAQKKVIPKADIVRFIHTTWDRESSILIGFDSFKIQENIRTSEDSAITQKIKISEEGVNYIASWIRQNCGDSVANGKFSNASAVQISVISNANKFVFFIQDKTSNKFLEKLIKAISTSPYNTECEGIIHELTIYDRLNKHLQ